MQNACRHHWYLVLKRRKRWETLHVLPRSRYRHSDQMGSGRCLRRAMRKCERVDLRNRNCLRTLLWDLVDLLLEVLEAGEEDCVGDASASQGDAEPY